MLSHASFGALSEAAAVKYQIGCKLEEQPRPGPRVDGSTV